MFEDNKHAKLIPQPHGLQDRAQGGVDDMTLDDLIERSIAIVQRTLTQWRGGALVEVAAMIRIVAGMEACSRDVGASVSMLKSIAVDIEEQAHAFGYPDIRTAAANVRTALSRMDPSGIHGDDGSFRGQAEAVTTCLAMLRMQIAEGRMETSPDEGDLLVAA